MSEIFYAKPDQTYQQHLEAVYAAWKETVTFKSNFINRLAQKYGFSLERFLKSSLLTIVLHDIGKMSEPFQAMMKASREGRKFNFKQNYRHELASFVFTAIAGHAFYRSDPLSEVPIEALSVAGHHKTLNTDLTSFVRERNAATPLFLPEGLKQALEIASKIFSCEGWQFPELPEGLEKKNPFSFLAQLIGWDGLLTKMLEREEGERTRILYILIKGILHYADWHGSGNAPVSYYVKKSPHSLVEDLRKRCQEKKIIFEGLRPFQKAAGEHCGHLIAVAPTGSGKTEASLLWALNNAREMGGAKIIYLLPTMVTANSIWQRLCTIFSKENVGLTHSTANLLLEKEDVEDEADTWENRRNVLFDQAFIRPVTVATVDQLLACGFNARRWVLKEVNAANAVIVLDEIHAYDGWTLGLIIATIRHFAALGSRFLLMSATLPTDLVRLFEQELKNVKVIRELTLLQAKRSCYYKDERLIDESGEEIEEAVKSGRKVLVVVNTVDHCQGLAQRFSHLEPICYHSRFILKDRKSIEDKIESARLVVATQVVEVSLDIDFDWLFTECAPPDAIAQRAGRVNRYRNPARDSRVFIFRASEKAEKIYNPINDPDLLTRSFSAFPEVPAWMSEQELGNVIEEVYKDYHIYETQPYKEAIGQYAQSQKIRLSILDNRLKEEQEVSKQERTRQEKYETISVIPACFWEQVISLKPKERRWYEVKVPYWYYSKNKKVYSGLVFCNLEYDCRLGAKLNQPEDSSFFVI
jgi:CRISPR-associated endonuclease/helicase Cas3